jgi:DNA-binding CsgD family transcriptional regulator
MKTNQTFPNLARFLRSQFQWDGKWPKPLLMIGIIIAVLLALTLFAFLFSALIQVLWTWLVPDLFPAAVRDGSLAGSISRWTAFKILIVLVVVGSLFRSNTTQSARKEAKKNVVLAAEEAPVVEAAVLTNPGNARVFPVLVDPLTDRELEVLQLLGKGLTNQQIAVQLSVSESTVVYHIGHIFGKLRVSSRVEAAVWAKEHGII